MPFQNIKFVHQDYTLTVEKGRNFACSINLITRAAFTKDSTNALELHRKTEAISVKKQNIDCDKRGHFGTNATLLIGTKLIYFLEYYFNSTRTLM